MQYATVYMHPKMCTQIGFAQAAGMPGDVKFDFKTQTNFAYPNIVSVNPQMVLRPFTTYTSYAYDIVINDPVGASGIATIPGPVMNDRFVVEVYSRTPSPDNMPLMMIACGHIDLTGYAYLSTGPLSPATYPTGPMGPAGPQGSTGAQGPMGSVGERGSKWYTGAGLPGFAAPIPDNRVDGDMYLDITTGDVWRWDAAAGTWLAFVPMG